MKDVIQSNSGVTHKNGVKANHAGGKHKGVKEGINAPSQQTIVQPKLELTTPGDSYEREADRMADFMMRRQYTGIPTEMPSAASVVHPTISRSVSGSAGVAVDTATEGGINASRGVGQPMPEALRSQMESGFGADFSRVRLHTDSRAADLSRGIQAKAFTYGNDIFFNRGQYSPDTSAGQHLIAHELTHVVQQSGKVGREGEEDAEYKNIEELLKTLLLSKQGRNIFKQMPYEIKIEIYRFLKERKSPLANISLFSNFDKPLNNYTVSGYDFSKRFLKNESKLGFSLEKNVFRLPKIKRTSPTPDTPQKKDLYVIYNSFQEADILVFSGHHYAQYKLPGLFTNDKSNEIFSLLELAQYMKAEQKPPLDKVKLVISTSCATLCNSQDGTGNYPLHYKDIFPNALFLGYRLSAPMNGSVVVQEFFKLLKNEKIAIDLSSKKGKTQIIQAWKKAIENNIRKNKKREPGILDVKKNTMEIFRDNKWIFIDNPEDYKNNECNYHLDI